MRELQDIVQAWQSLGPAEEAVLATVVRTSGSTYRKTGARMLLKPGMRLAGSVSGGCIEAELLDSAWRETESGPAILTFDASSDDDILWGYGLGCNGVVHVLLQRVNSESPLLEFLKSCLKRPGAMKTHISPCDQLGMQLFDCEEHAPGYVKQDGGEWLIERISSPQKLIVFGAGHDSLSLIELAKVVGYRVTVADWRETYTSRIEGPDAVVTAPVEALAREAGITPGCAVVLMTHNYLNDLALLLPLLRSPADYVGLLGPRSRAERMLRELHEQPNAEELAKLHAPIGLDLGSDGPEEIALAILAEIQAWRHGRPTRSR